MTWVGRNDILLVRLKKNTKVQIKTLKWSLKTEQKCQFHKLGYKQFFELTNNLDCWFILYFYWEFDPGSGWTLAACLRHASRTERPTDMNWNMKCLHWLRIFVDVDFPLSGRRVSNTWVIYLRDWDNSWKRLLIPDDSYLHK